MGVLTAAALRLPAAQHAEQPWENGHGVSRVVATSPVAAGFDTLDWQVSVTAITRDCPFSALPGLDRRFTVIDGAGVELDFPEQGLRERVERQARSFAFRGDWRASCRLLVGPVQVLNVITRRGRCAAEVELAPSDLVPNLRKAAGETLLALELGTLEAWVLQGAGEEVCVHAPTRGGETLALIRIR